MLLALAAAVSPSAASGEKAFQRCYSCHSVDPKEQDLEGPNLAGVVGRPAATLRGFRFSPAMRAAGARGLVWTEAALDRYLRDPEAMAPKTSMNMPPLRNPRERAAIIAYLKANSR